MWIFNKIMSAFINMTLQPSHLSLANSLCSPVRGIYFWRCGLAVQVKSVKLHSDLLKIKYDLQRLLYCQMVV